MKVNAITIALLVIYLLVQAVYVLFFPLPFVSDSATYLSFAQSAIQENTYYPNPASLYDAWLAAPVYINWIILLLKVFKDPSIILWSNIILNTLQLALVYKLTEKMFNSSAAFIAGVLYVVYLNNLGMVLLNLTEFPFGVLILCSIYFYISSPTIRNGLICGLTTGLAIGVRPTAWAMIIAFLIIYLIEVFQQKAQHKKMVFIVIGVLLYIIPMGMLSNQNVGRFEFTSTTGPANFIMSNNPKAIGVFDPHFFYDDSIYLTKKTYVERNEYLLQRSKEYIRENPGRWISLIPRKLYSTFISDVWAIPHLLHDRKWDLNNYLKGKEGVREALQQQTVFFRATFWLLNSWQQLIYGVIAVFFIYQLYTLVSGKRFSLESLLLNLFIAGGLGLTIISSVGNPRYKYSFLIVGIVLVSPIIEVFLKSYIYPLLTKKPKVGQG